LAGHGNVNAFGQPGRVFRLSVFSVDDAEKIKYERNDNDGAKYTQATAHAPPRMTVVATTDAEEQQQNYNYQEHDLHLGPEDTGNHLDKLCKTTHHKREMRCFQSVREL
jgi:hypothetical protein